VGPSSKSAGAARAVGADVCWVKEQAERREIANAIVNIILNSEAMPLLLFE
jgi:hypothetical protein